MRLPNKFVQEGDIMQWLQCFELFIARVTIPEVEWAKEGPVKMVYFVWSATWDCGTATTMRQSRNVSDYVTHQEGNKVIVAASFTETGVTWKVGKPLEDNVRELRTLVEKAYPCWTVEQQEVLYLFI